MANSIDEQKVKEIFQVLNDKKSLAKAFQEMDGTDFQLFMVRRHIFFNWYGVNFNTVIYAPAWDTMLKIRKALYNPSDKGINGKLQEIKNRLDTKLADGITRTTYREFSAHKQTQKDIYSRSISRGFENKSSVGNWLYSSKSTDLLMIRKEYERRKDHILWEYDCIVTLKAGKTKPERQITYKIHYDKTWKDFFRILDEYNGDFTTFFHRKPDFTNTGVCYRMQELSTSQKKAKYLAQFSDF